MISVPMSLKGTVKKVVAKFKSTPDGPPVVVAAPETTPWALQRRESMSRALETVAARVVPRVTPPADPLDGVTVEQFIGRLLDAAGVSREEQLRELLLPRLGDLERAANDGDQAAVVRHAARLRSLIMGTD